MVKIIYADWSNFPEKIRREVIIDHDTVEAAVADFIKNNWGNLYKIVKVERF